MNKEKIEKYEKEYENMSLCDLADEFVVPLFEVKDKDNLLKIIYINYAYERDEVNQLETNIEEALKTTKELYEEGVEWHWDNGSLEMYVLDLLSILERGKE